MLREKFAVFEPEKFHRRADLILFADCRDVASAT